MYFALIIMLKKYLLMKIQCSPEDDPVEIHERMKEPNKTHSCTH